jgi:hypothetical protein
MVSQPPRRLVVWRCSRDSAFDGTESWKDGYEPDEAHPVTRLLWEHGFQTTVEKWLGQGRDSTLMASETLLDMKDLTGDQKSQGL